MVSFPVSVARNSREWSRKRAVRAKEGPGGQAMDARIGRTAALQELRGQIEECRRGGHPRAPLRDALWRQAAQWAERLGPYQASGALGVSHDSLRRRTERRAREASPSTASCGTPRRRAPGRGRQRCCGCGGRSGPRRCACWWPSTPWTSARASTGWPSCAAPSCARTPCVGRSSCFGTGGRRQ